MSLQLDETEQHTDNFTDLDDWYDEFENAHNSDSEDEATDDPSRYLWRDRRSEVNNVSGVAIAANNVNELHFIATSDK